MRDDFARILDPGELYVDPASGLIRVARRKLKGPPGRGWRLIVSG